MTQEAIACCPQITLDDYEIKEKIGEGGFGLVVHGTNKKTGEDVAIKCFPPSLEIDVNKVIRGINISNTDIPGLVKTIGYRLRLYGEEKANSKYREVTVALPDGGEKTVDFTGDIEVMHLYKTNNLEKLINDYLESKGANHEKINPTIRSKIIFGVASIMRQLHSKNIISRSLKIQNIFLNEQNEPVICDFHDFKSIENAPDMKMAIGTPYCMAPELFMDESETYSLPVDVYAYGILLYKMFAPKLQFADNKPLKSPHHFMMKISKGERPVRPEGVPDHYWELIENCWKQNPDERPTFEEITNLLKDDKYALEEFGLKTNIDELHEYQKRVNGE